jgi:NTP pyrophosphatase (non-canonical NTP hydrolase)
MMPIADNESPQPISLNELQMQAHEWRTRNFPGYDARQQFLGMVEEMGELAHVDLKEEQRIRGMSEAVAHEARVDAIGDLIIFLTGYCTAMQINLAAAVDNTWLKVQQRDWVNHPTDGSDE